MRSRIGKPTPGVGASGRMFEFVKQDGDWKLLHVVNLADELAGQLIESKTASEREALLQLHPDLVSPALVWALVNSGLDIEIHGNY